MALLGRELKGGSFEVEDYVFAGLAQQAELPVKMETEEDKK